MTKSQVLPIWCTKRHIDEVQSPVTWRSAPSIYLGVSLLRRLKASDLQPFVDKLAGKLSGWKATLLQRSRRLILVRVMLTAQLHVLIAIDAPRWIIKAIDKIRRGFLWKGKTGILGGHCPVACERVMRPLHLGGFGIHNLELMGYALKLRWLRIQGTEPNAPTTRIKCQVPPKGTLRCLPFQGGG